MLRCFFILQKWRNTLPHEFIFVFDISMWGYCRESCQESKGGGGGGGGGLEKIWKGGIAIRGLSVEWGLLNCSTLHITLKNIWFLISQGLHLFTNTACIIPPSRPAGRVRWNRVCPSFYLSLRLSGHFLGIVLSFFWIFARC